MWPWNCNDSLAVTCALAVSAQRSHPGCNFLLRFEIMFVVLDGYISSSNVTVRDQNGLG